MNKNNNFESNLKKLESIVEKLENGEAVEIKNPPKHLVEGGYIIKQEKGTK